jgi:AAA+ superfamily predicted ATPase
MSSRPIRLAVLETVAAPFADGMEHINAELDWLRLVLHREVLRLKAANLLSSDPFRGLYLSDDQVDNILRDWSAQTSDMNAVHRIPAIEDLNRSIDGVQAEIDARMHESITAGAPPPMARLASLFDLSAFDCKVLIAALAVDLDLRFEMLYSWARNDVTRRRPSIDLLLKLLCTDRDDELRHRESFRDDFPLLRHQLLRISDTSQDHDPSFLALSLRIEDRIAAFLMGQSLVDKRLASFTTFSVPSRSYTSLYLPERLQVELGNAARLEDQSIIYLCGPNGAGKRSAVEALCADAQRPLLTVDLRLAVGSGLSASSLFKLLQREAVLTEANLFLAHAEALLVESQTPDPMRIAIERLMPEQGMRIYIAGDTPWPTAGFSRGCVWHNFDLPVPSFSNRFQLWQEALMATACPIAPDTDIQLLANRFALTGGAIYEACHDAARHILLRGTGQLTCSGKDLEAAARAQSSHGLRRFAQKVHTRGGWSSLVLPPYILRQLRDVCTAERHRHMVYSNWGFDGRLSAGKGLNVLFCGTSGTGKTMAAGILAQELSLDLYRIDLSIVVSKYIGETEKQLSLIFREAQTSNAVLLFDEADALFGKRSEVKDAHDRYANIEVAYLLQKMEEYEGIVILATNLRRNMDDAFTRRLHHIVEFPFPDAEHRERIWKGIFPLATPVAGDVDFGFLARQFELAGGNIRNIALAAAFLAADENSHVRMEHCIIATALELQKTGKLPSRSEFRDYYDLIRSRT